MTDEPARAEERTVINLRPTWRSMLPYLLMIVAIPTQQREAAASFMDMAIAADKYNELINEEPKTVQQLYSRVLAVLSGAAFETDNEGQIVVYTGLFEGEDKSVVPLDKTIRLSILYNVDGMTEHEDKRFLTLADANLWLDELGAARGVEDIALIDVEGADKRDLQFG